MLGTIKSKFVYFKLKDECIRPITCKENEELN